MIWCRITLLVVWRGSATHGKKISLRGKPFQVQLLAPPFSCLNLWKGIKFFIKNSLISSVKLENNAYLTKQKKKKQKKTHENTPTKICTGLDTWYIFNKYYLLLFYFRLLILLITFRDSGTYFKSSFESQYEK